MKKERGGSQNIKDQYNGLQASGRLVEQVSQSTEITKNSNLDLLGILPSPKMTSYGNNKFAFAVHASTLTLSSNSDRKTNRNLWKH